MSETTVQYGSTRDEAPGPGRSTLDLVAPGNTATVVGIRADAPSYIAHRLSALGLVRGTQVTVVRAAPLRDPRQYRFRDTSMCLRGAQASLVIVEAGGDREAGDE